MSSTERVKNALQAVGLTIELIHLQTSTRTAQEAADAVQCDLGQIVKSLIFRGKHSGQPVLLIASGKHRVAMDRVAELIGEPIERPNADFVRKVTGFAIGGVAPVGHETALPTWIDETLLSYRQVWAAAGTPNSLFAIAPDDLVKATQGKLAAFTETVAD